MDRAETVAAGPLHPTSLTPPPEVTRENRIGWRRRIQACAPWVAADLVDARSTGRAAALTMESRGGSRASGGVGDGERGRLGGARLGREVGVLCGVSVQGTGEDVVEASLA